MINHDAKSRTWATQMQHAAKNEILCTTEFRPHPLQDPPSGTLPFPTPICPHFRALIFITPDHLLHIFIEF